MKAVKNQDLKANLATNLKRARARRKLSLRGLGEAAGLSGVYVWQIEAGIRNPALLSVSRLADALGTTVNDLLKAPRK